MKKMLITGGTVFVSKFTAGYFVEKGYDVYVLNRGTREQVKGVTAITEDRHELGNRLKDIHFDVIADITSYDAEDVHDLLDALGLFDKYIMISSSAVYDEDAKQPFTEDSMMDVNVFWGKYGTDKIAAEEMLLKQVPDAYILRPPYLYGPMNNVYRESFVFDCAMADRKFYIPGDGSMKLQFFHVRDLCRVIEKIVESGADDHIINVGNKESVSIKEWVSKCYACLGKEPSFVSVGKEVGPRNYFSFYDYEYSLDVTRQSKILDSTVSLDEGLKECYSWYKENSSEVKKKPLIDYIDNNLMNL